MIVCKSDRELSYMRDAGRIVAEAHKELEKAVQPGITTQELDRIAEDYILAKSARPAFKNYHGYPSSICSSVNEEVVHGIPSLRKLENGDIISIDVGTEINGYYGDSAVTLPVGDISSEAHNLIRTTEEALWAGINKAINGNRLSDISHSIQVFVEDRGYSVVRDYVGHGIGSQMHEDPQIPNFGGPGHGPRLRPGMTLAIEPMVNQGTHEVVTLGDKWTVVTKDKKLSAHFEHSIAVTEKEPEILTKL
ncbi:MAG TPA: type I methionyl aminopeptidase [Desulfobacteria bacterium]|nr:type I methionyl aminopeptidase [Desulfobacteria bacterium]